MDIEPIIVADGDVLTVTADAGSYGTVFNIDGRDQWTVSAKSPLRLGPGRYRIETVVGAVRHEVISRAVAALASTLPRATEIVSTAANIAGAIVLSDKFKRLAERSKTVPAKLAARADKVNAAWDAIETEGEQAFDGHERILSDAEQSVQAAKDALNQLTNN